MISLSVHSVTYLVSITLTSKIGRRSGVKIFFENKLEDLTTLENRDNLENSFERLVSSAAAKVEENLERQHDDILRRGYQHRYTCKDEAYSIDKFSLRNQDGTA